MYRTGFPGLACNKIQEIWIDSSFHINNWMQSGENKVMNAANKEQQMINVFPHFGDLMTKKTLSKQT